MKKTQNERGTKGENDEAVARNKQAGTENYQGIKRRRKRRIRKQQGAEEDMKKTLDEEQEDVKEPGRQCKYNGQSKYNDKGKDWGFLPSHARGLNLD